MWFRRYWSVFVFTPVGFVGGFLYAVLTGPTSQPQIMWKWRVEIPEAPSFGV